MTTDVAPRPHRTARRILWGLLLALIAGIGAWTYLTMTVRFRLAADIEAAGGLIESPGVATYLKTPLARLAGQKIHTGSDVLLRGQGFDDAWVVEHDDLRAASAAYLVIHETRLSREAVMRIAAWQNPKLFIAPGIPFTDDDAAVLGAKSELLVVNLIQSAITDRGLSALEPQRLVSLNVAGTRVTADALCRELAGSQLQTLYIDGPQFTPELAADLVKLKSFRSLVLVGPDVTDAHVERLESMTSLIAIVLDQTSASAEAVSQLKAAHSGARIVVLDAQSTSYRWRADRGAAGQQPHD